jgi:antitoxin ParD1/3/4
MATMNISLPDQMKEWVEQQVATGRYANASDVMRDVIRERQDKEVALEELFAELQRGLDSGISTRTREELIEYARLRSDDLIRERHGSKKLARR